MVLRVSFMLLCCLSVALAGCGRPVASATLSSGTAQPVEFTLRVAPDGSDPALVTVSVDAAPEIWQDGTWDDAGRRRALTLYVEPRAPQQPGMAGEYGIEAARLWFRPRFPLLPGQAYRAEFLYAGQGREPLHLDCLYEVPPADASIPARVDAIYPSSEILPANHLKFYVLFSEPMQQSEAWKRFTLLDDATGRPVPEPFRHTELWSQDGRRLTLWFHPGRQKTGVNLNLEIGPVLHEGRRYSLQISENWHSVRGALLEPPPPKHFTAVAADHQQPDLNAWEFHLPQAGTRDPLRMALHESLDWALLQSQLAVATSTDQDAAGRKLTGRGMPGPEETSWEFTPVEPWVAGRYQLSVGSVLEDHAGNSLARPFEVDLQAAPNSTAPAVFQRDFEISTNPAGVSP